MLLKLFKADAVTKMKALRTLMELTADDTQNIADLCACWPRLYTKLSLVSRILDLTKHKWKCFQYNTLNFQDSSFQVRQLAHRFTHLLCNKSGKAIEKHIRELLPHWILGLHDPVHEVCRQAKQTFEGRTINKVICCELIMPN